MTSIICRKFRIDAGHRVYKHEGKCAHIHGHSYEFWVYLRSKNLDQLGRVIDYGVIKDSVGTWLEDHWDHAMLLYNMDPIVVHWNIGGMFSGMKCYFLSCNPTAENLARELLYKVSDMFYGSGLEVDRVVCWETPNCFAEARWEDE
jgi:6-pyruvoyltetrahydropterin/6-carboxytetrahydropterin synthase